MGTFYQIHPALTGILEASGDESTNYVAFRIPGIPNVVHLPRSIVVKVQPPEPANGTILLVQCASYQFVAERDDGVPGTQGNRRWYTNQISGPCTFEEVVKDAVKIVRLIPSTDNLLDV